MTKRINKDFVGYEKLFKLHQSVLKKFEDWALNKAWDEFGPKNHFDWW